MALQDRNRCTAKVCISLYINVYCISATRGQMTIYRFSKLFATSPWISLWRFRQNQNHPTKTSPEEWSQPWCHQLRRYSGAVPWWKPGRLTDSLTQSSFSQWSLAHTKKKALKGSKRLVSKPWSFLMKIKIRMPPNPLVCRWSKLCYCPQKELLSNNFRWLGLSRGRSPRFMVDT